MSPLSAHPHTRKTCPPGWGARWRPGASLLVALALLAVALPGAADQGAFLGEVIEPPAPAADFTLRTPDGKSFRHSARTYVIDAEGRLRLAMPFGTPNDTFLHDLRTLLKR